MKLTYVHATSWLGLLLLVSCGQEHASPAPSDPEPPRPTSSATSAELVRAADRRVVTEALSSALAAPEVGRRRAAAVALARMRSAESTALLRRALRDTDPEVRASAALGLGGLEDEAGDEVAAALAQALAAEPDPGTRALLIRDLGRLRRDDSLPAIAAAVRSEQDEERSSGCRAAAERGLGGRDVPPSIRSRAAALLAAEQPASVRLACAYALARLPAPAESSAQAELVALTMASADPDPEVRALAHRGLGRRPEAPLETLVHGTRDDDWRVAVQAFRSLATRAAAAEGGAAVYAQALAAAHGRATNGGRVVAGGPLHVLLAALDAGGALARTAPVHELSVRIHRELGELPPDVPATRDRGLAHCAAAELVDRGRGWPSRVESCGLEQVLPREQRARAAAILGDVEGAEEQRVVFLVRLYGGHAVVNEAVLAAAARIWHPTATDLILRGLREEDPGVLAAACDALAAVAGRAPTETRVPPPLPVERAVEGLRSAGAALPETELEGLVSWLGAVEAVDARTLAPRARTLAEHPSYAVRHRARALLTAWEEALPQAAPAEPPNVIDVDAIPDAEARPRVTLQTDRGEIVLELRPDQAPVTVARFVGLVRDGFYDGLTFHRVVPGFVAQGGDPRGDGYGGPGFWQRCEESRLPYVRGTVGMALAGRDTGGSQFFLTQSAQPHLEGRYTAFGMVVEGLERLDLLQAGDRIRVARVSE